MKNVNEIKNQKDILYPIVFKKYMDWVNQVSEDLENKTFFSADEIVDKVLELALTEINNMPQISNHTFIVKPIEDE
jgi:hypothetical protein